MKTIAFLLVLLTTASLLAADGAEKQGAEKKKGDAAAIQGKWTIVESFHKGEKDDKPVGDVVDFSGKKMTVSPKGKDKTVDLTFEIRPDKKPKQFDMIMKFGDNEITMEAIYELSGDTLKICALEPGKGRPEAVGTAPNDERRLLVLKRVKADDKK